MDKDEISNLTDVGWASENELGTIEEIVEYKSGEQTKRVKVVAHILSGAELDAIEAVHSKIDLENDDVHIDVAGFNRAKMCRIFRIDEKTLDLIFNNKSSNLRTKLTELANRVSGAKLSEKEQKREKNSDSPGTS